MYDIPHNDTHTQCVCVKHTTPPNGPLQDRIGLARFRLGFWKLRAVQGDL